VLIGVLEGNIEIGKHLLVLRNERNQLSWKRIGMDIQQANGKITFQSNQSFKQLHELALLVGAIGSIGCQILCDKVDLLDPPPDQILRLGKNDLHGFAP